MNLILKKAVLLAAFAFEIISVQAQEKTTSEGFISFYSEVGDITAASNKVTSKLNTSNGSITFSVPINSFIFEKALMQKHFNDTGVMDAETYPKATFKGSIANFAVVDLNVDGTYNVTITGDLTLRDQTLPISALGTIVVNGNKVSANSTFNLNRFSWRIDSKKKAVSQTLKLTVKIEYK